MPYEILGLEVSQAEQREIVLDIYTFWQQNQLDAYLIEDPEIYRQWVQDNPTEAKDYLDYCLNHYSPEVRAYAGLIADDWAKSEPDYATETMILMLGDQDEVVRKRIIPYYYDVLTDDHESLLDKIGATNYHRLLKAYISTPKLLDDNVN
jgi:hypothetical protein